ncbi:hypothetical protein DL96DRAFT_1708802 [Flagelloscypha sp. PMI_526]|nr:hypothetical protein DL96DRAFT_1708802 [Flagelloscypha sp. PMI_526]
MSSALEKAFGSATLSVVVPETASTEPPKEQALVDKWLERITTQESERGQAFYDELLESLLLVRIEVSGGSPSEPPKELLSLLSRVQISVEAAYISASSGIGGQGHSNPRSPPTLQAPPRTQSLLAPPGSGIPPRPKSSGGSHHPSIFPPATPNPTPFAAEQDKRYINAEGTPLLASFWGQDNATSTREAFWLLWSEKERSWVAVYRLALTVAFLRLNYHDPLLCLTVSTTLRERPLNVKRFPDHPISHFLRSHNFSIDTPGTEPPDSPDVDGVPEPADMFDPESLEGLVEVNLLENLGASPSFKADSFTLPSTRLGTISRMKHFLLPFQDPTTPSFMSPGPVTALKAPAASTMKKSFRKTLATVSGFRVRMRTVFVPAFMLPHKKLGTDDHVKDVEDPDASVNDERTVVLCVEIENSGEAGESVAFQIEKIDVKVQSAQAQNAATPVASQTGEEDKRTFPLAIGAYEQYNLLYAVTFLRNPAEDLKEVLGSSDLQAQMQRAVAIEIFGRPVIGSVQPSFPTPTFASKWNCILDLSSASQRQPAALPAIDTNTGLPQVEILPEPASPFPGSSFGSPSINGPGSAGPRSALPQRKDSLPPLPSGTEKRHTMPTVAARAMGLKSPPLRPASSVLIQHRMSEPFQNQSPKPSSILPPSISAALNAPRSPTTYGPPSPSLQPLTTYSNSSVPDISSPPPIPPTPAYPSFPHDSALPQSPMSTGPRMGGSMSAYQSNGSDTNLESIEIRREKGVAMMPGSSFALPAGSKVPQTPTPVVAAAGGESWGGQAFFDHGDISSVSQFGPNRDSGQMTAQSTSPMVVSVGILPASIDRAVPASKQPGLVPFDHFILDIFVYNQSPRTRRLEVSCPIGSRRRKTISRRKRQEDPSNIEGGEIGVLPLDNNVRIGPLLPSTCQSVRMKFLAITPGIHAIESLTLTDIETGFVVNLRSVLDIVQVFVPFSGALGQTSSLASMMSAMRGLPREILSEILEYFPDRHAPLRSIPFGNPTLKSAALVNTLWASLARPKLWSYIVLPDRSLVKAELLLEIVSTSPDIKYWIHHLVSRNWATENRLVATVTNILLQLPAVKRLVLRAPVRWSNSAHGDEPIVYGWTDWPLSWRQAFQKSIFPLLTHLTVKELHYLPYEEILPHCICLESLDIKMESSARMPPRKKAAPAARPAATKPLIFPAISLKEELDIEIVLEDQIMVIPNFLTPLECKHFISFIEQQVPLTLTPPPKKVEATRVNYRFSTSSPQFANTLFGVLVPHLPLLPAPTWMRSGEPQKTHSCNPNIRIYKYLPTQYFGCHYDDSVRDPVTGARSEWTLLIYLSGVEDGVQGGETIFYKDEKGEPKESIIPPLRRGSALLHRHGNECLLHEGSKVLKGMRPFTTSRANEVMNKPLM